MSYYNPYMNSMYPAQQRLNQLEQQQQNQQMQYNQQYIPQYNQQMQFQQPQQGALKGRVVTSFDEAKASMIDLDGSLHIFPDISNGYIYTKQINLDGTATTNKYKYENENKENSQVNTSDFVKRDEFSGIVNKVNAIDSVLNQLLQPKTIENSEKTEVVKNE